LEPSRNPALRSAVLSLFPYAVIPSEAPFADEACLPQPGTCCSVLPVLSLCLYVVIPSEALFADERPAVGLAFVFRLFFYVVIPSEAAFADEGPAVRLLLA
jgi:hypothetical protein